MTPTQIKEFPGQADRYVRANEQATNDAEYRRLLGVYNNDNEKFMDMDILGTPGLTKGNINFFLGLQRKEAANGDPRVDRAKKWIQGSNPGALQELGIYSRTQTNKDNFDMYTGALHEAVQAYQEVNGKSPDEKTVTKEIFPSLIKQVSRPGALWGTNESPLFSAPLPDEVKDAIAKDLGRSPTDEEARQTYIRGLFMDLYGKQKAAKAQGQVP
jgi:hypothetical protein